MKKLIALMLVLVMAVSFAACSQPAAEEPATTETTTPAEGTTEEAPAAGELKWDAANVQASVDRWQDRHHHQHRFPERRRISFRSRHG